MVFEDGKVYSAARDKAVVIFCYDGGDGRICSDCARRCRSILDDA